MDRVAAFGLVCAFFGLAWFFAADKHLTLGQPATTRHATDAHRRALMKPTLSGLDVYVLIGAGVALVVLIATERHLWAAFHLAWFGAFYWWRFQTRTSPD